MNAYYVVAQLGRYKANREERFHLWMGCRGVHTPFNAYFIDFPVVA